MAISYPSTESYSARDDFNTKKSVTPTIRGEYIYRNGGSFHKEVKANPENYDAWFDYLRLMESESNVESTRESYERAIANVPPSQVACVVEEYV